MKDVVVITGGGSGMGLAAAKFMPKEKIIVISGRTVAKLENAVGYAKKNSIIDNILDTSNSKMENLQEGLKEYADYAAKLLSKIRLHLRCAHSRRFRGLQEKLQTISRRSPTRNIKSF